MLLQTDDLQSCEDIVLIGPIGAGKTTISQRLADVTGLDLCSLDEVRVGYYKTLGSVFREGQQIEKRYGPKMLLEYTRPHVPAFLESILRAHKGCIFDFGAGDTWVEGTVLNELKSLLARYPNVFLILPSLDKQKCMFAMLGKPDVDVELIELNRQILDSPANAEIARHTIVREGKTVDQVVNELLSSAAISL